MSEAVAIQSPSRFEQATWMKLGELKSEGTATGWWWWCDERLICHPNVTRDDVMMPVPWFRVKLDAFVILSSCQYRLFQYFQSSAIPDFCNSNLVD